MSNGTASWRSFNEGKARRAEYLALRFKGMKHADALDEVGVKQRTYYSWREKFKDFGAQCDSIRAAEAGGTEEPVVMANTKWTRGFAEFRKIYFGMDSPWFHLRIIEALETGAPGSVTLITIPPEHGKTTTLEDYCCYKLALEPTFRITIGSEKQQHARKVLKRVKHRMEDDGPFPTYRHHYGPFRAPKGNPQRVSQTWAADMFDVFKRGAYDERDYSMVGLGMGSAIAGTRTDLLVPDDPQSQKSLDQTDTLFETFRQDWLSRPGSKGRTVVLMTRQGEGDFAEKLMESEILDHHIVLPAWDDDKGWLWPERYSPEEYAIMKRNVGQEAWDRNYLQIARPKNTIVFARETIALGRDEQRSMLKTEVVGEPKPLRIGIGMDPGYNVAGLVAGSMGASFDILQIRKPKKLSGTEDLIANLEDLVSQLHLPGEAEVTDVVIESKAFQKGLLVDERILAMQRTYGFLIHPHETDGMKYDIDIGIPQMVHSLLRREITWPFGDEFSREMAKELEDDMYRWRPYIKGNKLEQDCLMAAWFIWLKWRQERRNNEQGSTASEFSFKVPALIVPGRSKILTPVGVRRG